MSPIASSALKERWTKQRARVVLYEGRNKKDSACHIDDDATSYGNATEREYNGKYYAVVGFAVGSSLAHPVLRHETRKLTDTSMFVAFEIFKICGF